MNELKQIRTMAEMILEKVSALEGATPYTKDIGFDHLAREYEAKPKFKVGDRVRKIYGPAYVGTVTDVAGDPQQALQQLIDEYVALSGLIVKNILGSIHIDFIIFNRFHK